ncbi:L-rhamnose/proton symporter RhaT [Opitutales bacterium ASA1]|uniref:L-rhamnose/proton symporter RhaT n=1 Tax=Congregicoccus parvus TaxID=3081749 RepID=UPI002B3016E0|nr:L-rhamnose/proton symporter RhaT [Opitutales bacterium ASA1]
MPPENAPFLGTLLHAVGAASAALCYTPQRWTHKWSWQTYWLFQASMCWLVLPIVFAWSTIPELSTVLSEAPRDAMLRSYGLGVVYGVGGIAFGVSIRYIGFSLTYAVAIGVSCVLGTFLNPILDGRLGEALTKPGSGLVVTGVILGAAAMLVTGLSGLRKERELASDPAIAGGRFNARVGLPICLLAGALSAVFSLSLAAGQPIADVARAHGAGHFEGNVIYLFSNTGAFTTTLVYAGWLATRAGTWGEFVRTSDGTGLSRNYLLAFATGMMWYLQFFFYGLGHVRMGSLKFSSWAIHMIMLILFSAGFGLLIGEWKKCRPSTKMLVAASIALLLAAVGLISRGNYLADLPTG